MSRYRFFAWLEIPYFIGIHYDKTHRAFYQHGFGVDLRIRFRNDLLRIVTSNSWTNSEYRKKEPQYLLNHHGDGPVCIPRYVAEANINTIAELVAKNNLPYLHVEQPDTVVELQAEFELSDGADHEPARSHVLRPELLPSEMFFNQQVLPKISAVVEAYRVATLPAVRFSIHPISEGLVDYAFIMIQDAAGQVIQQNYYTFDPRGHNRSMQHHVERLGVQTRFDAVLDNPLICEFEIQFCSAYYLFHMRRWTEAVTIASGVVDQLIRQLVFSKLTDPVANAIWSSYRTRTDELFNRILPGLDFLKLADSEPVLWQNFRTAKGYRGAAAHGQSASMFSSGEEDKVRDHLVALYSVARWLSLQSGRSWMLDVTDDGGLLKFF